MMYTCHASHWRHLLGRTASGHEHVLVHRVTRLDQYGYFTSIEHVSRMFSSGFLQVCITRMYKSDVFCCLAFPGLGSCFARTFSSPVQSMFLRLFGTHEMRRGRLFFLSLSRGPCPRRFVLFNQTLHTSGILRLRPLSRLLVLHGLEYNRHILRDVL